MSFQDLLTANFNYKKSVVPSAIMIIALVLGLSTNSFSQEVISEFDDKGLVILNEELRQNSNEIKNNANDLITRLPAGIIVMWSGTIASIPSGWHLCDGTNGTPNLTNRFIVCANADSGGVAKSTVTGVAAQSGDGQLIEHLHAAGTLTGGAHTHGMGYYTGGGGSGSYAQIDTTLYSTNTPQVTGSGGAVAVTGSTANTGTGTKNVAVFYALAYIQKL